MIKVSFQGEHGAYSEMAAYKHFGKKIETLPCRTFKEMFEKVESVEAGYAMVPVENSNAGDVNENWDLLMEKELPACGEEYLAVHHCLIGQKNAKLEDIKKAYSHPQALAQSSEFLEKNGIEKAAEYDTAGAVRIIKKRGNNEEAAIASELAAKIYDLKIIEKQIETNKDNTTRFLIISKKKSEGDKTSIVFSTKHIPGALYRCMGGFARKSINITKLVSRPMKNRKWEYVFYLDFMGNPAEEKTKNALETLQKNSTYLKILGNYKAAKDNN